MPIRIACPECGTAYALPESMNGKKVRCMKCSHTMIVTPPEPVEEVLELEAVEPEAARRPAKAQQAKARPEADIPMVEALDEEDVGQVEEAEESPRQKAKKKAKKKVRRQTSGSGADLYRVALYQKIILLCVLATLILIGLQFSLAPASLPLLMFASIPVSILSSVFLFLLTAELYGIVVAVVLACIGLAPIIDQRITLLNPLILIVINVLATRLLKSNDLGVGLLGASLSEARKAGGGSGPALSAAAISCIAALVVVGAGAAWFGGAGELLEGSWPEFDPRTPVPKFDNAVTLHISGVKDKYTYDSIYAKIQTMKDPAAKQFGSASIMKGERMTVIVGPIENPKEFASKIEFGTVRGVSGRTIRVEAGAFDVPAKEADELTKALFDLKLPHKQVIALRAIKEQKPDDARRGEVLKAVEPFLNEGTHVARNNAIEVLGVWGTKDQVPLLLDMLADPKSITHWEVIGALGKLKDPRAIEPLTKSLTNIHDCGEAVKALVTIGKDAEKPVAALLRNPDRYVRQNACEVLAKIGTSDSIPALETLAKQSAGDVGMKKMANDTIKAIQNRKKT